MKRGTVCQSHYEFFHRDDEAVVAVGTAVLEKFYVFCKKLTKMSK
jgi:hypothetical protein